MSWFAKKPKPPPVKHEVGFCKVTIEMVNWRKYERLFFGEVCGSEEWPIVITASFRFEQWMERNGKHGCVSVGKAHYVPFHLVNSITPAFEPYQAEVNTNG